MAVKEKLLEILLVACSLPFALATLILGVIRFQRDRQWTSVVKGKKALPDDFPCQYFRGRTFMLAKDEFPQDELYLSLLPTKGTDVYIIIFTTLYFLVAIGLLMYLSNTTNPVKVVRRWVLLWTVGGTIVVCSLLVTVGATATKTTLYNHESYSRAVQSISIFEGEHYGIVVTGESGGETNALETTFNHLKDGVTPFRAFRLREQCQALITILQYCGGLEVDSTIDSPTISIRQEKCKVKAMTEAGFCPSKSYFKIFISFLVWAILHVLSAWVMLYRKLQANREIRDQDIPVFHEAQEAQGSGEELLPKKQEVQPYYSPSHPDQYERLKKYNEMFLREFNQP